ncbi:heparinase [Cytophagaceae bacterium SJW1-29]|uniref:Heparinase n=2 Tax=Salmonirosea aquatica TaxID=2654236 RepID=A0A7C9BD57_9BACT|nr:heparinase [Cytophagaceae bacterium SJW1-29]
MALTTKLIGLGNSHPRLLLAKGEEKKLLKNVESDRYLKAIHTAILAECDRLIGVPPVERIQIGRRLLDKSRECLRRVFQLAYAYRTTGQKKYLQRAEKEMLAVAAFSDWNPTHFLDVAEMTMAVAIGYDWLYNDLSAGSRGTLRDALINKGVLLSFDDRYNWFLTAEHNWNQVCNAGMTFGALAIAEEEPVLAGRTIRRALTTIPKAMVPYGPDGGYPEGFGYWEYGTSFNVLFLSALEKSLGTDFGLAQTPGFLKTAGFEQNIVGPQGTVHNWGDSGAQNGISPAMFWFAAKNNDPSLLWMQRKVIQEQPAREFVSERILPALLIWGNNLNLENSKPPTEKMWIGQGPSPVAFMRTSWADTNAIFVGFKGGSASVNHAHMDAGSFVLDALGERWAMDFGPQNYNSLEERGIKLFGRTQDAERWDIFRYNNLVHNTLTIDGHYQNVKGYAQIDAWSDNPQDMRIVSDLSTVYEGQAAAVKRGIALLEEKYVVVRDEVKAPAQDITLRWTLLTPAEVKILDDKTVALSQHGKTMYLHFNAKVPLTLKTWSTVPTHDYDAPNPGTQLVGFEALIPANTSQGFNVSFSHSQTPRTVAPLAEWSVKKAK